MNLSGVNPSAASLWHRRMTRQVELDKIVRSFGPRMQAVLIDLEELSVRIVDREETLVEMEGEVEKEKRSMVKTPPRSRFWSWRDMLRHFLLAPSMRCGHEY